MKLSTKGRYGLRAMFALAKSYGEGPLPLGEVAMQEAISEAYLEQLVLTLRRTGLVRSVRGAQGGYELAKAPEEITVGDIIRALDGPMAPSICVMNEEEGGAKCARSGGCVTQIVWEKIRDGLNEVLDGITLQSMLDDEKRLSAFNTQEKPYKGCVK